MNLNKFHEDRERNVDFLLLTNFDKCAVFDVLYLICFPFFLSKFFCDLIPQVWISVMAGTPFWRALHSYHLPRIQNRLHIMHNAILYIQLTQPLQNQYTVNLSILYLCPTLSMI